MSGIEIRHVHAHRPEHEVRRGRQRRAIRIRLDVKRLRRYPKPPRR